MQITKVEEGVIVMKDGKAWIGGDMQFQSPRECWGDPADAELHKPEFVKKPSSILRPGDFLTAEINTGHIVRVRRTVTIEILS